MLTDRFLSGKVKITISSNHRLVTLSGIDFIDSQYIDEILIHRNESLTHCAIESFCQFLMWDTILASENFVGCNSSEEILSSCAVATNEPLNGEGNLLYPNPTTGVIRINGIELDNAFISIINAQGKTVNSFNTNYSSIDITNLLAGLYFIFIRSHDQFVVRRILKI